MEQKDAFFAGYDESDAQDVTLLEDDTITDLISQPTATHLAAADNHNQNNTKSVNEKAQKCEKPAANRWSLSKLIASMFLLLALLFGWMAIPGGNSVATPDRQIPKCVTTNIEDIRVGDRVLGRNPLREQVDNAIEPDTSWKLIKLRLTKEDGKPLNVELLRPVEWLAFEETTVGGEIFLDLPEMGAVGWAEVLAISSCPEIVTGDGNIVTGRFIHQSADCIDLHIDNQSDSIACTPNHPFWSEDRQDFIEAGELLEGERVLLYNGDTARITQKLPRPGPEIVYNIEVWNEHVYCVGTDGVLVHNACIQFKRWKRGERIDKPMPDGSAPSFDTVKKRYWKNRHLEEKNLGNFSDKNLQEMKKGNAPLDFNRRTGKLERRELHHVDPQRYDGANSPLNLRELTPDWHAEVDPFRKVPGIEPIRGIR